MTKARIWIKVVPQIYKHLVNTLVECKGTFEARTTKSTLFIMDVVGFNFDSMNSEPTYMIRIDSENNTKDIFIAKDNVEEFTVHFS